MALASVRQHDPIAHEDAQTANPRKRHHRAKSISDAIWAAVLAILSDTAACAGRSVVAVDPACASPALAAARWFRKASPSAGIVARSVEPACSATITPRSTF
jgi:hypothetical protein